MVARETRRFKSGGQAFTGLNWSRRTSLVRPITTEEFLQIATEVSQLVPKDLIGETTKPLLKRSRALLGVSIGPEGPHW